MELGIQMFSFKFIKSQCHLCFRVWMCVWSEGMKTAGKECGQCVGVYVQVIAHRDKLSIKKSTRCIKYPKFILSQNSTCFGHLLCPS
jgi:hypothetical protein